MQSVGERLRLARESQNRTLASIANETRISLRYLEAIEADQPSKLPGYIFYRSWVKQYAGILGLNYAELESEIEKANAPVEVDPLPILSASYHATQSVRPSALQAASLWWAAGLLLLVFGLCTGLYALWSSNWRPWQHRPSPESSAASPVTQPPPAVTPVAPQAQAPNQAAVEPAASPAPSVAAPETTPLKAETPKAESAKPESQPGKISVNLSAKEKTWVSVVSDGKTVFSGVLDASQTKEIASDENARLLTGNAAGLDVVWNGKPIGPIGPRGQVRIVVFTRDNFQILQQHKL
jgi:cytoskeleton protein RodZ